MARAPKTIKLPLPKSLKSNKLEDIQNHLRLMGEALDSMYKLLLSDITTVNIGSGSDIIIGDWIYFGDARTDGSWRIGREGNNWVGQRREAGSWTPSKAKFTA